MEGSSSKNNNILTIKGVPVMHTSNVLLLFLNTELQKQSQVLKNAKQYDFA
jgi:hypothetical protein